MDLQLSNGYILELSGQICVYLNQISSNRFPFIFLCFGWQVVLNLLMNDSTSDRFPLFKKHHHVSVCLLLLCLCFTEMKQQVLPNAVAHLLK